jgi:hypothetical protein
MPDVPPGILSGTPTRYDGRMNTALLLLFVVLFLGGCQLSLPRQVVLVNPAETLQKAMPAPQVPLGRIDCDRDGLASYEELRAGFDVNHRAVTLAEFQTFDRDRDAHWNEREFQAFLQQGVSSWSVDEPCDR